VRVALLAAARGDDDTARSLTDEVLQWATPRRVRAVQWATTSADGRENGGFGNEPKFPQADALEFLVAGGRRFGNFEVVLCLPAHLATLIVALSRFLFPIAANL